MAPRPLIIAPIETIPFAEGEARYQMIDLQGLAVQGNLLQVRGVVTFPAGETEGHYWDLYWVGDNVVRGVGLEPRDDRIKYYWADGVYHTQSRSGVLAQWEFSSDTSCRVWLLFSFYGNGRERLYALYDLRQLGAACTAF
jgi:hypothetical protein